jgi:hypothetical protein
MHSRRCDALRRNVSTDIIAPVVLCQASIRIHCHLEITTNALHTYSKQLQHPSVTVRKPLHTPRDRTGTIGRSSPVRQLRFRRFLHSTTPNIYTSKPWVGSLQARRMREDPQRPLAVHSSHLHDPPANNATPRAMPSSSASTRTMSSTA